MSPVKEEETEAGTAAGIASGHAPDAATEHPPKYPLGAGIEALLISSDRPLNESRLGELLGLTAADRKSNAVRDAIDELNESYAAEGRAFTIERLAGGWQILTRAEYGPLLASLHRDRAQSRLSQAALETLAIISYRQPIMRAEIEAIRGVAAGEVLRGLLERRLVKIVGRAEELGRPMLYGTTREFLKVFGLAGMDDLPVIEGLEAAPAHKKKRVKPKAADAADANDANDAADAADATDATDAADAADAADATDAATEEDAKSKSRVVEIDVSVHGDDGETEETGDR